MLGKSVTCTRGLRRLHCATLVRRSAERDFSFPPSSLQPRVWKRARFFHRCVIQCLHCVSASYFPLILSSMFYALQCFNNFARPPVSPLKSFICSRACSTRFFHTAVDIKRVVQRGGGRVYFSCHVTCNARGDFVWRSPRVHVLLLLPRHGTVVAEKFENDARQRNFKCTGGEKFERSSKEDSPRDSDDGNVTNM